MATAVSNNRKYLVSVAAIAVIAIGAYGLGRVYPPLGPTAGTIAPADRYVSSQVGENDVTLGDTSVAELMQTDAFEVMTKNPSFRALASDPGFAALAQNSQAMAAIAANPQRLRRAGEEPAGIPGDTELCPSHFCRGPECGRGPGERLCRHVSATAGVCRARQASRGISRRLPAIPRPLPASPRTQAPSRRLPATRRQWRRCPATLQAFSALSRDVNATGGDLSRRQRIRRHGQECERIQRARQECPGPVPFREER